MPYSVAQACLKVMAILLLQALSTENIFPYLISYFKNETTDDG